MMKYDEKKRNIFWTFVSIYIIIGFMLGLWAVCLTGQPSEADVYFDLTMLAEFELIGSDGDIYNHHVKVSGFLTVKSDDGPLASGKRIYGDKWQFRYVPDFPEGHDVENFRLNFSLGSYTELDRSDTEISILIEDLKSYKMDDVISLSKENGYLLADRSGIKQLRMEARWNYIGHSHDVWEYSEYTNYTTIRVESYEVYQKYFHTRLSVVAFVVSAYFVAVPATIKSLKELNDFD